MIGEATAAPATTGLRRVLGSWGTAALSIGVMAPTLAMAVVGPESARLVGRAAPLAFVVAALLVLLVSVGFVRLSADFASAGSVYAFVGGSIGPRAGVFTGAVMLGTYLVFPWVSVAGVTLFGTELLRLADLNVDWIVVALAGWLVVGGLAAGGLRPATSGGAAPGGAVPAAARGGRRGRGTRAEHVVGAPRAAARARRLARAGHGVRARRPPTSARALSAPCTPATARRARAPGPPPRPATTRRACGTARDCVS